MWPKQKNVRLSQLNATGSWFAMHTGLNDNPFLAPKDTTSGVSSDRPNQRVARIISYAALVMLLSCFVCFALSTYQVAMILGVKDYKGYFAPLLFWAVLSWFLATLRDRSHLVLEPVCIFQCDLNTRLGQASPINEAGPNPLSG
jgi:hypothetical protein